MNLYKRLLDEFYDTAMATPITNIFNPAYAASTTARPTLETINEENNQENALQKGSNDLASVVDDPIHSSSTENDKQEEAHCIDELNATGGGTTLLSKPAAREEEEEGQY